MQVGLVALTLVGVAAVRVEHGGRGCSRGSQVPRGLGPVGAHQPSERELSNQQLGRSLVLADLAQRHRPRSARARQGLLTGRRCGAAWAEPAHRKRCGLRGLAAAAAAAPDGAPASWHREGLKACARWCAQNWRRTCQSASEQGSRVGADQLQRRERQPRLRCAALGRRRGAYGAAWSSSTKNRPSREGWLQCAPEVRFFCENRACGESARD